MKKIGIVCDDWKVKAFQSALNRKGFEDVVQVQLENKTTLLTIQCLEKDVKLIQNMCKKLEIDLKLSN